MNAQDQKLIQSLKVDLSNKPNFDDAGERADKLEQLHASDITNVWISMLIDDLSSQNQSKAQKDLHTIVSKLSK